MLDATDAFVAKRPDFPIKIGLYTISSSVKTLRPIRPYERSAIRDALATLPLPGGGTAIGAGTGTELRQALDGIYQGKILAEAPGAGEREQVKP